MKKSFLILFAILLITSCVGPKKVPYFQDLEAGKGVPVATPREITFEPGDQLSIIVTSRDQELAGVYNLRRDINSSGGSQTRLGYTIDKNGYIDFPQLGKIKIAGMTRNQVAEHIKKTLVDNGFILDPVVIVDYGNLQVSVLGEVKSPGKYSIEKDQYTILDAISMAGDLTIQGERDNIMVLRYVDGVQKTYVLNINDAAQLHKSDAYYLKQNDIVYVEPNSVKAGQASINGNTVRSTSFWMSLASFIMSFVTFITR